MPYNTRNPVGPNGSSDPRDLFDNSAVVDVWATDRDKKSHPDRMGVPRKTWAGMEQAFDASQIERDLRFLAAQGDRTERFNALMLSTGYQYMGPFAAGLTFTEPNQFTLESGVYWRPAPGVARPFTTTGVWATDSAKFTPLGDDILRSDLGSTIDPALGASLVFAKSALAGAVARNVAVMSLEVLNIKNYGAIGDGNSHQLGEYYSTLAAAQLHYSNITITSLTEEVDWAATQCAFEHARAGGRYVFGPAGTYISTTTVVQPQGVKYVGEGPLKNPSTPQDPIREFRLIGTNYLFKGTGPRVHVANLAACAGATDGDQRTNVSTFEPGYDSTYRKTSFWNNDANPVTGAPATQKLFSCGWKVEQGGFAQLRDVGLLPYYDGINGYNTDAATWADDWDIGLWVDNHHDFTAVNVSVVGFWRMAGCFGRTALTGGDTLSPDWERNKFLHCNFQGFASFLVRGSDLYDIKAVGADWIEIEWFDSHPFDPSFDNTFRTQEYGGLFCTYTGTQKVGANLRITGVTPSPASIDPANTANKVILGERTNGVADANWDNCYFYGMNHRKYRATSAAFSVHRYSTPSRCIEISGANIRGLKFNDSCKIMSCDDIALYLGNVLQLEYNGSFESKDVEGRGTGIRNVAGSSSYQIRLGQRVRGTSGLDNRPAYPTTDGRFTTPGDPGMFSPNQVMWDGWSYGLSGHVDIRPGAGQRVGFTDATGVPVLYRTSAGEYGYLDGNGVRIKRYNPSLDQWTTTGDVHTYVNRAGVKRAEFTLNDAALYGAVTRLYNADGSVVMWRNDYSSATCDHYGRLRPDTDGTRNLADVAKRYNVVFAVTGTINTSDGREKTPMRTFTDAELAASRDIAAEIGAYKFLTAVEEKGDQAREHIGMYVQTAIEIMQRHGLDPFNYSFICYDQWPDEYQEIPAEYAEIDGEIVEVAPAYQQLVTKAGDRYSFRYDGLSLFISAGQEQRLRKLEDLLSQ
ncbi:tail fiber domain-containing protein [Pseudomonas sp. NPDC089392]|uniref:tail fiber domain-containing protein n=1 Tax=Pseudomonas sp. NPDC089392 TaxID=3364459 RepID=UPI0037F77609